MFQSQSEMHQNLSSAFVVPMECSTEIQELLTLEINMQIDSSDKLSSFVSQGARVSPKYNDCRKGWGRAQNKRLFLTFLIIFSESSCFSQYYRKTGVY